MFERLLSKGGLSLDRLRTLIAVKDACGITLAARGDAVTQSLYSRQIRELEEFFGVKLVARKGKGITITAAGNRLAEVARECLHSLESFLLNSQRLRPRIEIGAGDSLLQWNIIPQCLDLLVQKNACDVRLHNLQTEEIVAGLRELTLDFGLVRHDAVTAPLQSQMLFRLSYALYVPESLVSKLGAFDMRLHLAGIPLALLSDSKLLNALQAEAASTTVNVAVSCDSFTQSAAALMTGKFAAVLPNIAATSLPRKDYRVIEVKKLRGINRSVHLAWNPRMLALRPDAIKIKQAMLATLAAGEPPPLHSDRARRNNARRLIKAIQGGNSKAVEPLTRKEIHDRSKGRPA